MIKIFKSPQFGDIRTAGTAEQPLFCLSDICKVLELQVQNTKRRLNEKGVYSITTPTNGGEQQILFVNEQNLYKVIMRSDKPQAEPFQDWVCGEVLPSIRKTGGYMVSTPEMSDAEIMARALDIAHATIARRDERIAEQELLIEQKDARLELQQKELKVAAPKVTFYDNAMQSANTMTTTQVAKSIGMEANTLNRKLRDLGIQYRQSGMWIVCAPYSRWKLHSIRTQTYTHSDGSIGTSQYTVWYMRGYRFIVALRDSGWDVKKAIKSLNPDWTGEVAAGGKEVMAE